MSKVARTVQRVYREASAAWHVSSRVTERLALVLTLFDHGPTEAGHDILSAV